MQRDYARLRTSRKGRARFAPEPLVGRIRRRRRRFAGEIQQRVQGRALRAVAGQQPGCSWTAPGRINRGPEGGVSTTRRTFRGRLQQSISTSPAENPIAVGATRSGIPIAARSHREWIARRGRLLRESVVIAPADWRNRSRAAPAAVEMVQQSACDKNTRRCDGCRGTKGTGQSDGG